MKKPRLQIVPSKQTSVKLGGSASSKSPSALMPKQSYSKAQPAEEPFNANFGMTGMTGED